MTSLKPNSDETNISNLKMYIAVNGNIKMSKGKMASQVGHAINILVYNYTKHKNFSIRNLMRIYMEGEIKKIILKTSQSTLEKLEQEGFISVRDKGYTELEPNTITCVNLGILSDINNALEDFEFINGEDFKLY